MSYTGSATAVDLKVGLEASSIDFCRCSYTLVPPTPAVCIHLISMSQGVKEVTLLGQNVNSYRDVSETTVPVSFSTDSQLSRGFSTIYKTKQGGRQFVDLLDKVSLVSFHERIYSNAPLIRTQLQFRMCCVLCVSRWIQK